MKTADLLDRTFWVFKHRYYSYMMINVVTFGLPYIVLAGLVFSGKLDLDFGGRWGTYLSPDFLLFLIIIALPSLFADLAMHTYTSHLVREEEIGWFRAIREAFSFQILNYFSARLVGWIVLALLSLTAAFINLIPVFGQFAFLFLLSAFNTFIAGLSAPVILEEKRIFLGAVGRNMQLAQKSFEVSALASGAWFLILAGFLLSFIFLFLGIGELTAVLAFGENFDSILSGEAPLSRFAFYVTVFGGVTSIILIYMPLSSIFYSVMYYSLRAKREGFHLENKLDLFLERRKREVFVVEKTAS